MTIIHKQMLFFYVLLNGCQSNPLDHTASSTGTCFWSMKLHECPMDAELAQDSGGFVNSIYIYMDH